MQNVKKKVIKNIFKVYLPLHLYIYKSESYTKGLYIKYIEKYLITSKL